MTRSTPEGASVWFQIDVQPDHKIEWTLELYLAYTSEKDPKLRCQIWDAGAISPLTEKELRELEVARMMDRARINVEKAQHKPREKTGGNDDKIGGLPVTENTRIIAAIPPIVQAKEAGQ